MRRCGVISTSVLTPVTLMTRAILVCRWVNFTRDLSDRCVLRLNRPTVSINFGSAVVVLVYFANVVQWRSLQTVRSLGLLLRLPIGILLVLLAPLRRRLGQPSVDLRRVAFPLGGPASKTTSVVVGALLGKPLAWRGASLLLLLLTMFGAREDAFYKLALRLLLVNLCSLRMLTRRVICGAWKVF